MALRSVNQLGSATDVSIPLDVRGWEVRTMLDEESVGKVHDVLVDESGRARYLDVDLGVFRKHVLLPIGHAITDESDDVVWVESMSSREFENIPEFDHETDRVTAESEREIATNYERRFSGARRYDRPELGGAAVHGHRADERELGTREVRLRKLGELSDYEVSEHDSDPRGWEVVGRDGERLGRVDDLVVDPQAMKARYLEVEVERERLRTERDGEDHMLVPIGYARLDDRNRTVRVEALDAAGIGTVPRYSDRYDESYERRISSHFESRHEGESRYSHPRYDPDRFFEPRTGRSGRTSVGGRATTGMGRGTGTGAGMGRGQITEPGSVGREPRVATGRETSPGRGSMTGRETSPGRGSMTGRETSTGMGAGGSERGGMGGGARGPERGGRGGMEGGPSGRERGVEGGQAGPDRGVTGTERSGGGTGRASDDRPGL